MAAAPKPVYRSVQLDATIDSNKVHENMNRRRPLSGGDVVDSPASVAKTPKYTSLSSGSFSFEAHIAKLRADSTIAEPLKSNLISLFTEGYVIIPDFLSEDEVTSLEQGLDPLLSTHSTGRNAFEGLVTQRCYALMGKSRAFDSLAMHPRAMEICERILLPNFLLTAFQAIKILPGEEQQNLHTDDGFCKVPRPRQPFSVAFIYAVDDFTAQNGSTVVVPKSHLWGDDRIPDASRDEIKPVIMKRGSAVCFLSTLWHGGGQNKSNGPRCALTAQYVEPWIRPQENQILAIPFDDVLKMPKKLQSLIGYSIHVPFIGFVNGEHPLKRIDPRTGQLTLLGRPRL